MRNPRLHEIGEAALCVLLTRYDMGDYLADMKDDQPDDWKALCHDVGAAALMEVKASDI